MRKNWWCFFIIFELHAVLSDRGAEDGAGKEGAFTVALEKRSHHFYGCVEIGTPGQVFELQFDSGSRLTWIASTKARPQYSTSYYTGRDPYFNSQKSSTLQVTGETFSLNYVDGTYVMGRVVNDTFKILTMNGHIELLNQGFGETRTMSDAMKESGELGVIGLKLSSHLFPEPVFLSMVNQNQWMEPVFGFYSTRGAKDHEAELVFGGNDNKYHHGMFNTHDVVRNGESYDGWRIKFDKLKLKPREAVWLTVEGAVAVPDWDTTLIAGPEELFKALNIMIFMHSNITVAVDYNFWCDYYDWRKVLPSVTLVMGGRNYELRPEDYIWSWMDKDSETRACGSGFHGVKGLDYILLGELFMKKYYTRFDMVNKRVQFALAKY